MKIAFFGLRQAIDYYQIGGTENFVRRLSIELLKNNCSVDYILYGADKNKILNEQGITLRYARTFEDALDLLKTSEYNHVLTIYLLPRDRIKFYKFRRQHSHSGVFHFIYFSWPDSIIKRYLYFTEAKFFPYNGKLFCISKRQYKYVSRWAKNAVYILPTVPDEYFLEPEEKPVNEKIKITFLGRTDPGKGISDVIEIFLALKDDGRFECSIYGIHIPEDKESFKIHKWLKRQKDIKYVEVERQKYSPAVDEFVRNILKETDIFIQPYQRLSSSIDTPLLLLEAMASLCAIITKPFGNIPEIYGKSHFLINEENFVKEVIDLFQKISYQEILKERNRIYNQNSILNFEASNIMDPKIRTVVFVTI